MCLNCPNQFHFLKLQADVDNSGTIDYGEFIAATLNLNKIEREDHLFAADNCVFAHLFNT